MCIKYSIKHGKCPGKDDLKQIKRFNKIVKKVELPTAQQVSEMLEEK